MKNFVYSFLFNDAEINHENNKVSASFIMDPSKEGWVGIPHGGIGMGAILELAENFPALSEGHGFEYPITSNFRMGGAEARIGDRISIEVIREKTGISGNISVEGTDMPYITGNIMAGEESDGYDRPYVPQNFSELEGELEHLPHYRNCFVCGVERKLPGLKRQFHLWKSQHGNITCAFAGYQDEDKETIYLFEKNGFIHPISLLAVLDETMGWAGFITSANGGVSVRLNYRLLRKIKLDEKVVFLGRGEKVMGKINKRMLFWASGCAAVVKPDGVFEVVAESSGQWYAMAALTRQMKDELIPEELTNQVFKMVEG